jgi:hypothetical protein
MYEVTLSGPAVNVERAVGALRDAGIAASLDETRGGFPPEFDVGWLAVTAPSLEIVTAVAERLGFVLRSHVTVHPARPAPWIRVPSDSDPMTVDAALAALKARN